MIRKISPVRIIVIPERGAIFVENNLLARSVAQIEHVKSNRMGSSVSIASSHSLYQQLVVEVII